MRIERNIQEFLALCREKSNKEISLMSQESSRPKEILPLSLKEEAKDDSLKRLLDSLGSVKDDVSQICELTSEEKSLVTAFFESLYKLMKPLTTTLPVSTLSLPENMKHALQANVDPTGHLIVCYKDQKMVLMDLKQEENRDLMIHVVRDIIPKFKQLTSEYRQMIEHRINLLSSVTKELQKISDAFSTSTA